MREPSAFTILELLIAVAIVGALAGIGIVAVDPTRIATSQAADGMANTITRTRFEAIQSNATARMEIDTSGAGSYRVCLDEGGDATCDQVVQTVLFGEGRNAGVVLTAATLNVLGFDRRGLPISVGGGEFTLENVRGTMTRTVRFTVAGDVEVE